MTENGPDTSRCRLTTAKCDVDHLDMLTHPGKKHFTVWGQNIQLIQFYTVDKNIKVRYDIVA